MAKARSSRRKSRSGGTARKQPGGLKLRSKHTARKGRTDGSAEGTSAVSASKTGLRRRAPRVAKSTPLTAADVARLPADAAIVLDGVGQAKLAVYYRVP